MRLPNANPVVLQKATHGFHIIQALLIPIIMGVTAASMGQPTPALSACKYMFAMCWLTIPALIYVTMTPRFPRTSKTLANPFAICGFNSILCFLWFIAPIALGSSNTKAQNDGFDKMKDAAKGDTEAEKSLPSSASCDTTTGTAKECSLNNAAVALGVFMFLFLLATTLMAIYVALYYRAHLITPWEAHSAQIGGEQVTEHTKHAFGEDDAQGGDYALIGENGQAGHSDRGYGNAAQSNNGVYDENYERQMAREGEGQRSRSVGSGSYETGRVGFPDGDYDYTPAGR